MNQSIKCSCGDILQPSHYKKHILTEKHKNNLGITTFTNKNVIFFCKDYRKIILPSYKDNEKNYIDGIYLS